MLRGHEKGVWAAEFSPDDASIVSGARDGTVRVWNAAKPDLQVLRGHGRILRTTAGAHWPLARGRRAAYRARQPRSRMSDEGESDVRRAEPAASGSELLVLRGHKDATLPSRRMARGS